MVTDHVAFLSLIYASGVHLSNLVNRSRGTNAFLPDLVHASPTQLQTTQTLEGLLSEMGYPWRTILGCSNRERMCTHCQTLSCKLKSSCALK